MTIHRLTIATPQSTIGQRVADIVFGKPETQHPLTGKSGATLRLVQPQAQPRNPIPGITRFAPEPQAPVGPKIGGGTWTVVVVGLGLMYFSPKVEEWLRTPPTGDYKPTPEEGIDNYLSRVREEMGRAFELGAKEAELRQLISSGQGDTGRAHILKQELAELQGTTTGSTENGITGRTRMPVITNSAPAPSSGEPSRPEQEDPPLAAPTAKRLLSTSGDVVVIPVSQGQVERARSYMEQPVIDPDIGRDLASWEPAGDAALEVLEKFDGGRQKLALSIEQLLKYLNHRVFQNGRVLQIGFSLGFPLRALGSAFTGEWIGVDYDPVVAAKARELNPTATVVGASAYSLPFPDHSFDVVYSHSFLDVLDDPERALSEALRVLRPGGLLLHLMDCIPNIHQLGKTLASRGFSLTRKTKGAPGILTGKGQDEIKVVSAGKLSDDEETLFEQLQQAERDAPMTTLSMLSMAHLLGVLGQMPCVTHVESGFLLSLLWYTASHGPELKVSNSPKLKRALGEDRSFWSSAPFRVAFETLKFYFYSAVRPGTTGLEGYVTDYLIAQKK